VNAAAGVALAVTAAFALGDWWAKLTHSRRLEYVCKPATMVALIVAALALDPAAGQDGRRAWFVAALVFSLAGDVFLMLPSDRFVPGLASFLVAHVCYVAGFWTDPPDALAFAIGVVVVLAAVGPVATVILRALRTEPALRPPVATYIAVIGAMVASALASGNAVAAAGAVSFAGSDSLVAWNRFVRPLRWAAVTIMVTYHVGQALLVLSLLK
jgi:uncharacterized membrane protein YhhN